ncbi:MAG: alpha/beta fold hydrolase [Gemmatimonadales bacterium]|nr:MAG: alpha/beta fold hydrolase [Gemmatimonadales bacterium]
MRAHPSLATPSIWRVLAAGAILLFPSPVAPQADEGAPDRGWRAEGTVTVSGGERVPYRSEVDRIILRDEGGQPTGEIWFTAYHRTDVRDASQRPLLFAYNGGPGSSSFWLHMGVMGPQRVSTPTTDHAGPPPFVLRENPHTLLDRVDIVMVDPVGTGFSRTLGDTPGSDFWGVEEDAEALTQFVQRYLSRTQRWNSPKYLLGESYGTMRSAVLAETLQGANIDLNGIVLVSAVLDLQTLIFSPGDDLPYIVNLPGYAVVSRYLGALPGEHPDLEEFMAEVEAFALGDYAAALLKGSLLTEVERSNVLDRLQAYTGLSRGFLERADLRVTAPEFEQELLRERGRVVGRLDARFTGFADDPLGQNADYDPQSSAIRGAYTAAWNTYLRETLEYDGEREYVPSGNVQPWNWSYGANVGFGQTGLTNVGPALARALRRNPTLEVLLVNGLYDLATPYFAAVWTMDHLGLPPELRDNIDRVDFEAGHMMYVHEPSLPRWRRALVAFIDRTSGRAATRDDP